MELWLMLWPSQLPQVTRVTCHRGRRKLLSFALTYPSHRGSPVVQNPSVADTQNAEQLQEEVVMRADSLASSNRMTNGGFGRQTQRPSRRRAAKLCGYSTGIGTHAPYKSVCICVASVCVCVCVCMRGCVRVSVYACVCVCVRMCVCVLTGRRCWLIRAKRNAENWRSAELLKQLLLEQTEQQYCCGAAGESTSKLSSARKFIPVDP